MQLLELNQYSRINADRGRGCILYTYAWHAHSSRINQRSLVLFRRTGTEMRHLDKLGKPARARGLRYRSLTYHLVITCLRIHSTPSAYTSTLQQKGVSIFYLQFFPPRSASFKRKLPRGWMRLAPGSPPSIAKESEGRKILVKSSPGYHPAKSSTKSSSNEEGDGGRPT